MTTQEIKTNIERLEKTISLNCWNKGYVANCKSEIEKYKSILETLTELDTVNAKIALLHFDNNGNAIDFEYTNSLFDLKEKLESQLYATPATVVKMYN